MNIREFFAREHRTQRQAADKTQQEVADAVGYSLRMIESVEQGVRNPSAELAAGSDRLFGLNGMLSRLSAEVLNENGPFTHLVKLEQRATDFRIWDMRLVPGLVQTPDYARDAIRAGDPAPHFDVEQRLTERLERQKVLYSPEPPRVRIVLCEAVLYRLLGTPEVLHDQLAHLLKVPANVEIQILPLAAGAHGGIDGPIQLMDFTDAPTVAHADGRAGGTLIDIPEDVAYVRRDFDRILAAALPVETSAEMITAAMEDL